MIFGPFRKAATSYLRSKGLVVRQKLTGIPHELGIVLPAVENTTVDTLVRS